MSSLKITGVKIDSAMGFDYYPWVIVWRGNIQSKTRKDFKIRYYSHVSHATLIRLVGVMEVIAKKARKNMM